MKKGDLVIVYPKFNVGPDNCGVIVGFNEKGEGGKDFVHVLIEGYVEIFMSFDLEVIDESRGHGKTHNRSAKV